MFHQFPHNFPDGLRLVLSGCDKQCIPSALFKELERRLHIDSLLVDQQQQSAKSSPDKMPEMDAAKAMESIKIISQQFASSRREQNTRLFAIWAPYLESVCRLADFLLRVNVQQTFRPDAPTAAMEKGEFLNTLLILPLPK
jgi:Uri superfamily endonuclease